MIIVKRPFIFLRDCFEWKYYPTKRIKMAFMSPDRVMLFEKREKMSCIGFQDMVTKKKTEDAKYKVVQLEEFFRDVIFDDGYVIDDHLNCGYLFSYLRLALKVVRTAEIALPTKEIFPLIVRNKLYNFYIAGRFDGDD